MVYGHLTKELRVIEHAALAPGAILEVLGESAMGNPLLAAKGDLMRKGDYHPNFQVYLQQKDLRRGGAPHSTSGAVTDPDRD